MTALADGWIPVGDNAKMLAGARQVFSDRPPLVGQVTSSDRFGIVAYHPGPLLFYVDAPFIRLLGDRAGLLVAAAVIQAGATQLLGYVVLRLRGLTWAFGAWLSAFALAISLDGISYLYDPFHSIVAIMPMLALLFVSWAMMSGDIRLLPIWVLVASFVSQASTQFLSLTACLGAAVVVGTTIRRLSSRRPSRFAAKPVRIRRLAAPQVALSAVVAGALLWPDGAVVPVAIVAIMGAAMVLWARSGAALWHSVGPRTSAGRRLLLATAVIGAVAWVGPIAEALTNDGGNFVALRDATRLATEETKGLTTAVAHGAQALLFSPARVSSSDATVAQLYASGALGLMAVSLVIVRWRRIDAVDRALIVTAAVGLVAGLLSVSNLNADEFSDLFRLLILSVSAAFAWFAMARLALPSLTARLGSGPSSFVRDSAHAAALGGLAVLVVVSLVPTPVDDDREFGTWTFSAVSQLADGGRSAFEGDGAWVGFPVGPRSLRLISDGLMANLEGGGVATAIHHPAGIGWNNERDGLGEIVGEFIVTPALEDAPDSWDIAATYRPDSWDPVAAERVAQEVADFAAASGARLEPQIQTFIDAILCPEMAHGDTCAEDRTGLPLPDLPAWTVALIYAENFQPAPTVVGPRLSADLRARLRTHWIDIPVGLYVRPRA